MTETHRIRVTMQSDGLWPAPLMTSPANVRLTTQNYMEIFIQYGNDEQKIKEEMTRFRRVYAAAHSLCVRPGSLFPTQNKTSGSWFATLGAIGFWVHTRITRRQRSTKEYIPFLDPSVTSELYLENGAGGIATQMRWVEALCWEHDEELQDGLQYFLVHEHARRRELYPGYCEAHVERGRFMCWPRWPGRFLEHHQDVVSSASRNHEIPRCRLFRPLGPLRLLGSPVY
jgi:hypothetical protein